MNKLIIIGNLTRDPELRTTTAGVNVCSFTVAVNRPRREGQEQAADYFRVTAWRNLADICGKYLAKGRKVAVVGSVSLHTYQANNETKASLEVNADDVEFLTPKTETEPVKKDQQSGFQQVETDELPF